MKIAIIGGGNLGIALAEGIIESKFASPQQITITKRNLSTISSKKLQGVQCISDNVAAANSADLILLAVKPFQAMQVLEEIKNAISRETILISVITGVSLEEIQSVIGHEKKIFRAMPNTAVAIKESMTCVSYANATNKDVEIVENLFSMLGKVVFIQDQLMDAATVLGACGTAFALRFIRANIQGGIEIGFDAKTASLIAAQTVKGAADLLLKHETHPEQEIDKVTTPKGCTIAGLNQMEHQGFSSSLIKGIVTSYQKIKEN